MADKNKLLKNSMAKAGEALTKLKAANLPPDAFDGVLEDVKEPLSEIRLQYKEPESFTEETLRTGITSFFNLVSDLFAPDLDDFYRNLKTLQSWGLLGKTDDLIPAEPFTRKRKLKADSVDCIEQCATSNSIISYGMFFNSQKDTSRSATIQFAYEKQSRMLYVTASAKGSERDADFNFLRTIVSLLWSDRDCALIPKESDGIENPVFLPGKLTEKEAETKIDEILLSDKPTSLPYVFFTKMLGFAYPIGRLSVNDGPDEIADCLFFMHGVAHVVMVENRDLARYITSTLNKRKNGNLRIPSVNSGFALLTWSDSKEPEIVRPEDCIDPKDGTSVPLEYVMKWKAVELITRRCLQDSHITMNDVIKRADKEKSEREEEIKKSDIYQQLLAENERLKAEQSSRKKSVPAAPHSQTALEAKCEELRVANGKLKLRIDALEAKNKEIRQKKAAASSDIILRTDGVQEMYDNEIYMQIMALLTDSLPNLRAAGATRRAEIVEGLINANRYDGEIDQIHRNLVAAAKTGRKEEIFSVLAEYNIIAEDKEHPAFRFDGNSAARDNMSGTPSDVHSAVNAAKHIGKTFF